MMTFGFSVINQAKTAALEFSPIDFSSPLNSNFVGIGVVKKPIGPNLLGKIRINGNRWSALNINDGTIPVGGEIEVIGRLDLVLYVQAVKYRS